MNSLIKTRDILRDIVEIYIPVATFVIMFVTSVLQIFFRYVVRQPLAWACPSASGWRRPCMGPSR